VYGSYPGAQVRLFSDTSEVRGLIAAENAQEEDIGGFWRELHTREEKEQRIHDMEANPDRYPKGRAQFLSAMANSPGFYVPEKSFCLILQSSKCRCGSSPIYTVFYNLVRITSGPSRGKVGWVCGPSQLYS
jgi:hypothetical protein